MDLVKKLNPFKKHRIPNAFQTNQLTNHINNNNTANHANNRNNQINNNETHSKKKAATEKELVNLNHKIEKLLADLNDNQNEKNFSVEEECVVCLTSRATMKTYPCGHRVVCRKCFVKTIQTAVSERCLPLKCVVCRTKILKLKQVDHKHDNGKKYKRNHRMQQQMQMEQNYTSSHFKRSVYSLPAPYQATALASRRQQAKEQLSTHYLSDCHFNSTAPYTSQARELNGNSHNNNYENHLNPTETKNTQTNIEITKNGILPRNNNFDYSTVNNSEHKINSIPTSYANRLSNIHNDNYPGKNYHFYNEKTNTSENNTVFNGIESNQKYDQDDNIGHLNNGYQSSSSTSIGSLQPPSQNNPYKSLQPHANKQLQQEVQKNKNRKFESKRAFVQNDKANKDSIIKIPPPPVTNKRRTYQKRSLSTSSTKPKKYNYSTSDFAFSNGTSSGLPQNITPVKPLVCASNLNSFYGNPMQVSLFNNNNNNNQTDLINNNVPFNGDMNIYNKANIETSKFLNDANEQNKTSISNINIEVLKKHNKHVYEQLNDNSLVNPVMITDSNNNNILDKNHVAISSSHKPHQGSYTINLSNFTFTSNNTPQDNNKCNICRQQKLLSNSKSNTCTHNTVETKTYKHSQLVYPCDRPITRLEGWTDKVEQSAPQQMSFLKVFSKKSKAVSSLFAVD